MSVSGGQGTITVTLTDVLLGESITVCGTGGPLACSVTTPAGGGTGTFTSVTPVSCVSLGAGQNRVSFAGAPGCTGTITLTWQCLTSGPVTFVLTSNNPGQSDRPCSLGSSGGSSEIAGGGGTICISGGICLALTANPNVVSCKGGSTTVTAFAQYQHSQVRPEGTPEKTAPNGLPLPQQPYFFFTVSKGIALIQQTSNNTAVVTLLEGMPEAEITATTGGVTNTIRVIPYCRPGSPGAAASASTAPSVSGTPGVTGLPVVTGTVAPPLPIGSLTITASPGALETCDGSIFLSATVKDTNGKLVPDGTNVLFIATRGILDPASANTVLGTANVVYTSDLKAAGSVKLSAQSGSAFASVDVPVSCNGVAGSTASGSAASGNLGASGSPTFRPPSTGQGGGDTMLRIRPPSTGDIGLKVTNEGESLLDSDACGDRTAGEVNS